MSLKSRLDRIHALLPKPITPVQLVFVNKGESVEAARLRQGFPNLDKNGREILIVGVSSGTEGRVEKRIVN